MSNWCPVPKLVAAVLLLLAAGCQGSPIQQYDAPDLFTRPPEVWEKDGGYHLRVYEKTPGPVGMGSPCMAVIGEDVHLWIAGRHSSGAHANRLFDLGLPVSSPPPRFFWRNPDDSLIPLPIVRR
jgi:hypothetical protein